MRFLFLISIIVLPFTSMAASSTLSCFGFHGPKASPKTAFAQDIDITDDLNNAEKPFKTYSMVNSSDFEISVTANFPQQLISVNLTRGDTISMSAGKFEGTKLILVHAKTKENLVYVECGVVTKN